MASSTSTQRPTLAAMKAKKAAPIIKTTLVKKSSPSLGSLPSPSPTQSHRLGASPKIGPPKPKGTPPLATNGHAHRQSSAGSTPRRSKTPVSRQPSKEPPVERVKRERLTTASRSSPTATTPHFLSDDDDDEEEEDARQQPKKRARLEDALDPDRCIADKDAFISSKEPPQQQQEDEEEEEEEEENGSPSLAMIHAYDIANDTLVEHQRNKYATFFTALAVDEDDAPTIELRYPGYPQMERYQLVKPSSDLSDFKPITEIFDNLKMVADAYLTGSDALKVYSEADGAGFYQKLYKYLRDGEKCRVGAQSNFISIIDQYNEFIQQKREDGTIQHALDSMNSVPLPLVEHIVKGQIYARTVSPRVHLVRQYEGFSDNVYGELLPKFLSKIFREIGLKSNQTFVDLGSGVGNCVLQAALETGCEAWGCEMMDNCATLAELQAREFPARCRLWGIKPGPVHLIHDDFLRNPQVDEVLKRADAILINNQAFTADLNDKLKLKFLDLKEGCRIVSLKYFRHPQHVTKKTNVNDPVNVLEVKEMHRYSGMVSWTDDPGNWYVQTKNSSELKRFLKTMS